VIMANDRAKFKAGQRYRDEYNRLIIVLEACSIGISYKCYINSEEFYSIAVPYTEDNTDIFAKWTKEP